ncbi:MAG: MBOAT family protein [Clostridia bacterium]|nr:MBOAT family protein [Clostridia bacterium]
MPTLSFSYTALPYLLFFAAVFGIYAVVPKSMRAPWLLLAGFGYAILLSPQSAVFALGVLAVTYVAGLLLGGDIYKKQKQAALTVSLLAIFGLLGALKYGGLLAADAVKLVNFFGGSWQPRIKTVALPIGVSFYSFAACGYLIDVYRGARQAERNFLKYGLFLVFFPLFVSGPIERADNFLEQIDHIETIEIIDAPRIGAGALMILWGYFLKLVIADRAALLVNNVFDRFWAYNSFALFVGAVTYAIQIYADFAGVSCMALGGAQIFGFSVTDNFDAPYFSTSIKDFWRRWHISLSRWFRDYLYIPLGGNRKGQGRKYLNILIVFLVCGIWHGANRTFLAWGLLHGVYQIVGDLTKAKRRALYDRLHMDMTRLPFRVISTVCNFLLVTLAWIVFRADSLTNAGIYIFRMFTQIDLWNVMNGSIYNLGLDNTEMNILFIAAAVMFFADYWRYKKKKNVPQLLTAQPPLVKYLLPAALLIAVLVFGSYGMSFPAQAFIYAEF